MAANEDAASSLETMESSQTKGVVGSRKGKWWEHAILFALVVGGGVFFLFLFSGMPLCKGDVIFQKLASNYQYTAPALAAAVAGTVVLLILDAKFWRGKWRYLAAALALLTLLGYCVAALLATKEYIVAPIGLFLFGSPFVLMGLKVTAFREMDIVSYLVSLQVGLATVGLFSFFAWLAWIIFADQWWDIEVKFDFYQRMQCNTSVFLESTLENHTSWLTLVDLGNNQTEYALNTTGLSTSERYEIDSLLVGCVSGFLLWLLPFILALWSAVFGAVLFFLVRTLVQARHAKDKAHAMDPLAQAFIMFIGLGLFGLWAAAGIAGAQMSLTNVVLALSFLAMIIMGVVVTAVFGAGAVQEGLGNTPLGSRMLKSMKSDWVKAIMLMLVSPFFVIYLFGSLLTQISRKIFPCTRQLSDEDKRLIFTTRATRYVTIIKKWNWTSVLVKSIWLGIFFFLLVVGVVRVTTVFLNWLNMKLMSVSLFLTTLVFIAVGIFMFLNPVIPGVPVYVSGGVILVFAAQEAMGFWGAVCYTMAVCFFLKMFAIILQQKVIGEMFASKRVWIRRLVAINSVEIRAIRVILLKPGMDFRKVAVLCGGPDWPVSVLTGILRLPLLSMMYGSMPVFFLIAPCVLSGALLLRATESGVWASLSTMSLAFATVTQSAAMLAAIHFIAKTIVEQEEELKQWPDDQEVRELERASEKKEKIREYVSHWSRLDPVNKTFLIISSFAMVFSCFVFQLFGSRCFVNFSINSSIEKELDNNVFNLVKPFGWVALAVFAYPCFYLSMFNCYVGRLVVDAEKNGKFSDLPIVNSINSPIQLDDDGSSEEENEGDAISPNDDERTVERKVCCKVYFNKCFGK